jgi:integrase/recombinase XerD
MAGGGTMSCKMVLFVSSLADSMYDFVNFKQLQGYDYTGQGTRLYRFDRFLDRRNYTENILTKEIIFQYNRGNIHLKPATGAGLYSIVRNFSKYLNMFKPGSYVLPAGNMRFQARKRYYLYSIKEICILIEAARSQKYRDSAMSQSLSFLIGLLYTTGLRLNEALKLTVEDIDFKNKTLFIRKGKFAKDRYVVLHHTVVSHLYEWINVRKTFRLTENENILFTDAGGIPIKDYRIQGFFHKLIVKHMIGHNAADVPRLHDLRHTYACNCVNRWREKGDDINAKLPVLSTAMGHVDISSTQIYLHITAANLRSAAGRYHEKVFENK